MTIVFIYQEQFAIMIAYKGGSYELWQKIYKTKNKGSQLPEEIIYE